MVRKPVYITIKDQKGNFNINSKYCLIQPAKSEPGKVAKSIVDTINKNVRKKLYYNQCRNAPNVIDWFQKVFEKKVCIFIKLDSDEFLPSITKHLLLKVFEYDKLYNNITKQHKFLIVFQRYVLEELNQ